VGVVIQELGKNLEVEVEVCLYQVAEEGECFHQEVVAEAEEYFRQVVVAEVEECFRLVVVAEVEECFRLVVAEVGE
jgi:DNA-binding protein Fis